jgi:hypothetical protein
MSLIEQVSEAELTHALEREIRFGEEFHKANAAFREEDLAKDVKERTKTVKGLGREVATIDRWTYFKVRDNYGGEAWFDREFIKDYQKRHPDLCANKA